MTHPLQSKAAQAPLDSLSPANPANKEATALRQVTCPLCHTPSALTATAVEAGGEWQCVRCGQQWDTARLAALANYALWLVENNRRVGSQGAGAVSIWEDEGRPRERDEAVVVH
jgi:hypothetical protein